MDVLPAGKGCKQPGIAGEVCHDPELNLRIIGGHELISRRGNKGLADAASFLGTHRDVLEIGIGGRKPAGGGHRLMIAGMHSPGTRIDLLW
jgi:hypothetical protein